VKRLKELNMGDKVVEDEERKTNLDEREP